MVSGSLGPGRNQLVGREEDGGRAGGGTTVGPAGWDGGNPTMVAGPWRDQYSRRPAPSVGAQPTSRVGEELFGHGWSWLSEGREGDCEGEKGEERERKV